MRKEKLTALIVIDVQNDFCLNGALAVNNADEIIGPINQLMDDYETIILTQDWHPENHFSFAINQPGHSIFETIKLEYGEQMLWPAHCVAGSQGANFHPDLNIVSAQMIARKGFRSTMDSYSAFFENDHKTSTGVAGYLQERNIERVALCGLATDYCVAWSAIDAMHLGFDTSVILPACRAIDLQGSLDTQLNNMAQVGINLID